MRGSLHLSRRLPRNPSGDRPPVPLKLRASLGNSVRASPQGVPIAGDIRADPNPGPIGVPAGAATHLAAPLSCAWIGASVGA
jgi:hypothetical protein